MIPSSLIICLLVLAFLVFVLLPVFIFRISTVHIKGDEVGIVIKKFDSSGGRLGIGELVALNGEAGLWPDTLAPGAYWGYWRWMYTVIKVPPVKVPPGYIAVVYSKVGKSIPHERLLGKIVECKNFQDARAFLRNGGEQGKQLDILVTGEYRINTELFTVITVNKSGDGIMIYGQGNLNTAVDVKVQGLQVYTVHKDKVGIVTVLDGASLSTDDVVAPAISGHSSFQNPQVFLDRGGRKGTQEEVLTTGSYNLNPWFLRVEQENITYVPSGTVGVVSASGKNPPEEAKDGLVDPDSGYRGIWRKPLSYGKHAINTSMMRVTIVPTHEITLSWSDEPKDESNYDMSLKRLQIYSKDGFLISFNVTQKIQICPEDAPKMIKRVGSMEAEKMDFAETADPKVFKWPSIRQLVARELKEKVEAFLRQAVQERLSIDFQRSLSGIKADASGHIRAELKQIGVVGIDTYILDVDLPDEIQEELKKQELLRLQQDTILEAQKVEQSNRQLVEERLRTESILKNQEHRYAELALALKRQELKDIIDNLGREGYLRDSAIKHWKEIPLPDTVLGAQGWYDTLVASILAHSQLMLLTSEKVSSIDGQPQKRIAEIVDALDTFSQQEGGVEKL